jgi:molybdopterin/thiamine biosynthesis adenylyltransferase
MRAFLPEKVVSSFKFDDFAIAISLDSRLAESRNGQFMALAVLNNVSRYARRIFLDLPPVTKRIDIPHSESNDLSASLSEFAANIDPSLLVARRVESNELDALVAIGSSQLTSDFNVTINSEGWLAELTQDATLDYVAKDNNPIGASVASAFAGAEVFKEILRQLGSTNRAVKKKTQHILFSALDYSVDSKNPLNPALPQRVDIGETFLVGAGAVGSSLVFTLKYIEQMQGSLTVIDHDRIDETNLNRYLIACHDDIGRPKVNVAASFLKSGVRAQPIPMRYKDYIQRADSKRLDLVISTVDNNQTREEIQSDLPREVLHGATHEQTFVVSRHGFTQGACLGCLFYRQELSYSEQISAETGIPVEEVDRLLSSDGVFSADHLRTIVRERGGDAVSLSNFVGQPFKEVYAKEICGTLTVQIGTQSEAATVSFVSAMPGILLAGELVKERVKELKDFRLFNYFTMSLFSPLTGQLMFRRKDPRCSCLCGEPIMINRYEQKWGMS